MTVGDPTGAPWGDDNRHPTTSKYLDPTGKPDAEKLACPVWSGGKAVRPYLSLLGTLGCDASPNLYGGRLNISTRVKEVLATLHGAITLSSPQVLCAEKGASHTE